MRFYALPMKLLFAYVPFPILAEMLSNVLFIPVLSFSSPFFTLNMYICFLYPFLLHFVNVLSYPLNCLVIFCLHPLCPPKCPPLPLCPAPFTTGKSVVRSCVNHPCWKPCAILPLQVVQTSCIIVHFVSYILCCILMLYLNIRTHNIICPRCIAESSSYFCAYFGKIYAQFVHF